MSIFTVVVEQLAGRRPRHALPLLLVLLLIIAMLLPQVLSAIDPMGDFCRAITTNRPPSWNCSLSYLACSQWSGIGCTTHGQINGIDMFGTGAVGTLPDSFSLLTQLETLSLVGGNFSGTLPAQMTMLKALFVDNNALTGAIPAGMNNPQIPSIIMISIVGNSFSGAWPYQTNMISCALGDTNHFCCSTPTGTCSPPAGACIPCGNTSPSPVPVPPATPLAIGSSSGPNVGYFCLTTFLSPGSNCVGKNSRSSATQFGVCDTAGGSTIIIANSTTLSGYTCGSACSACQADNSVCAKRCVLTQYAGPSMSLPAAVMTQDECIVRGGPYSDQLVSWPVQTDANGGCIRSMAVSPVSPLAALVMFLAAAICCIHG